MSKTIDEIYGEMLAVFAEASGYLPSASCDLAARLYAAAAQIHALLLQAQWVLEQGFPQTAQGEYLERLAALRGISRSVATCATGFLRFGVSSAISGDLSVKSGTTCMTDTGIRFAAAFLYIGLVCAHLHSFENTVYCNMQPFSLTGSHFRDGERGIQCPLPEKSILPGWQAAVWSLSCASCCGHTDGTLSRCWTG